MAKLFMQEVPEIYDGIITIRSIARDPGSRAKIAVTSNDSSIDPVGACVGMRGSRVQAVVGELQGEKIDIIPWTENIADLVVSALQPADVAKVVLDEQAERIEVVVPDEQLSLAIGRRGQNVRLASQLIGWDIDILTEQEESERRQKEFTERSALFMQALDVDEMVAQLLASEGFSSVEELAYIDLSEIASIQGFDEETAAEIQNRAIEYLAAIERAHDEERTGARRRRRALRDPRPHRRHAGGAGQGRHQDGRGFRRLRRRRSGRLDRTQGWRSEALRRHLQGFPGLPRGSRGHDHAGPPQGRLGDRGRSCAAGRGRRPKRGRPRKRAQPGPVPRSPRPTRECALTRETKPVAELVRFVVSPDGVLVPDIDAKAEGRGVWITLGQQAVAEAVKKKAFAKSLKTSVTVPDDLAGLTRSASREAPARRAVGGAQGRPDL